jgi:hypothetical protein
MRRVFVMALALLLPACAEVQTGTAEAERTVARVSPAGPISIIYRDDESNERILNGNVSYDSVLGRDRAVHFTVKNQSAEPVCDGTFTKEGPNNGKFFAVVLRRLFQRQRPIRKKNRRPEQQLHRPWPDLAWLSNCAGDRPARQAACR